MIKVYYISYIISHLSMYDMICYIMIEFTILTLNFDRTIIQYIQISDTDTDTVKVEPA